MAIEWFVSGSAWRLASFMIALALCFPAAMVLSSQEGSAADPAVFKVGVLREVSSLNPFSGVSGTDLLVFELMYDPLTGVLPDFTPGPRLAESWWCDEPGLVWTFNLTADAYWHDGEEVTADDVAFTYNLIMSNPDECAMWFFAVRDVVEAVALSDQVVRITTSVPRPDMPGQRVPILPEHLWSNVPLSDLASVDVFDPNYFPNGPVGCGPFTLEEFENDEFLLMYCFSDYHGGSAQFDALLLLFFSTEDAMLMSLEIGAIDMVYDMVSLNLWDDILAVGDVDGQAVDFSMTYYLGINCASEDIRTSFPQASDNLETTNLSVRQAIAHAVNRTHIMEKTLFGLADAGETLLPMVSSFWHYDVPSEDEIPFDVSVANDILDAAGYIDSDLDGVRENSTSGVPLEFDLYYIYSNPMDVYVAENVSCWLSGIGVNAVQMPVSESMMFQAWFGCKYDLFIWDWIMRAQQTLDPNHLLSVMTTDAIPTSPTDYSGSSDSFYSNEYYDSLYELQAATVDPEERQSIIHEMQALLYSECPYVVLYYPMDLFAYRTDTFTGYPDMASDPSMSPALMKFYLEISPVAGNQAPGAEFLVDPSEGNLGTTFVFDAGACTDDLDDPSLLEVRWDWDDDGVYDTSWSSDKTATHQFAVPDTYTVRMEVKDTGGLTNETTVQVVVYDDQAPSTEMVLDPEPNANGWFMSDVNVTLASTDDSGTVLYTNYTLDGSNWTAYSSAIAVTGEGVHMLEFYSTDPSMNVEEVRTGTISIDGSSPSVEIVLDGTSASSPLLFNSSVEVTVECADTLSGMSSVQVSVDGAAWAEYDAPVTLSVEGIHSVEVVAHDSAGNNESAASEFMIDLTDPVTEVTLVPNTTQDGWYDSFVWVTLSAEDGLSDISETLCRLDDGAWAGFVDSVAVTEDGMHTLEFYSIDLAGNQEALQTVEVWIDTQPPVANGFKVVYEDGSASVTYNCTDEMSGVAYSEYSLDGAGFIVVGDSATVSVPVELEGEHSITVHVYDVAGNVMTTTYIFTVEFEDSSMLVVGAAAAGIAAVAAVAALLLLRRRKQAQ